MAFIGWSRPQHLKRITFCAVLNSPVLTKAVQPLMSYGKDERDVAKHVWKLPVPEYDPGNELHIELAEIGSKLEQVAAEFSIAPNVYFPTIRRRLREALDQTPEMIRLIEITKDLLG